MLQLTIYRRVCALRARCPSLVLGPCRLISVHIGSSRPGPAWLFVVEARRHAPWLCVAAVHDRSPLPHISAAHLFSTPVEHTSRLRIFPRHVRSPLAGSLVAQSLPPRLSQQLSTFTKSFRLQCVEFFNLITRHESLDLAFLSFRHRSAHEGSLLCSARSRASRRLFDSHQRSSSH